MILRRYFILSSLILCLFVAPAWAATYYVSASSISTLWSAAQSMDTPCTVETAFANAQAGDTVYFRGGTYNVPAKNTGNTYTGYYSPTHTGTSGSPIVFASYHTIEPSEPPAIMNGTAGGTGDKPEYATIFGNNYKDYITLDGFTIQADSGTKMGRIILYGNAEDYSTGLIVKRCTFNGGDVLTNEGAMDNTDPIFLQYVDATLIQECTIYGSDILSGNNNVSGLKTYTNSNLTVEGCYFHSNNNAIYLKSGSHGVIIRNCHFYSNRTNHILIKNDAYCHDDVSIYNNLFRDAAVNGIRIAIDNDLPSEDADNMMIYNNTFYNASAPGTSVVQFEEAVDDRSTGCVFRDNVIASPYGTGDYACGVLAKRFYAVAGGFDYNAYGAYPDVTTTWGSHYRTLVEIRAATLFGLTEGNHNLNSVDGAIVFTNASGTLSGVSDFSLAPSSPGYKAGSDGNDMGADISLVGPDGSESEPSTPATTQSRSTYTISGGRMQ